MLPLIGANTRGDTSKLSSVHKFIDGIAPEPFNDAQSRAEIGQHADSGRLFAYQPQNSPAIRVQYKKFCHTSFRSVRKVVKNMRAAKHRYETMTKPLGRGVLYVVANIKTAAWCAQTRADSSGSRSKVWLQWVNEERYLQGSMQADASDQVMMVTRLLDDEKTDPAIVNREISACLCTLVSLFGDEKRCLEVFGYTRTMLDILRKPIVWHVGNKIYSLGSHSGVSDEVIDRCLQRMRCWLTLLKATCAAEFPSFEIMQARSCFELRIFF